MQNVTLNNFTVKPADGLQKTISLMNLLENKSMQNPVFVKWVFDMFGSNCIPCIPGKIWRYVQENFKFVSDDPYDEILTAPYLMPELKKGDCDDFALFIKTCMDIIGGYNTHYILFGKILNKFTHIAVFVDRGSYANQFVDPIVLDGANSNFNIVPIGYSFYKLI